MPVASAQRPRRASPVRRRTTRRIASGSADAPAPGPLPRGPSLAGLTILVVEDHADSRELLRQVLESLGPRVLLAENGYDALGLLRTEPGLPDVILCDLLMPTMDGLNFAKRLQQAPEWQSIPIVAVTALGQLADYILTWTHGFQAHLTKPVDPALLVDVVKGLVQRRSAESARLPGTSEGRR